MVLVAIGRSGGPRRPTHDTRRHPATSVSVQDGGHRLYLVSVTPRTPRIGGGGGGTERSAEMGPDNPLCVPPRVRGPRRCWRREVGGGVRQHPGSTTALMGLRRALAPTFRAPDRPARAGCWPTSDVFTPRIGDGGGGTERSAEMPPGQPLLSPPARARATSLLAARGRRWCSTAPRFDDCIDGSPPCSRSDTSGSRSTRSRRLLADVADFFLANSGSSRRWRPTSMVLVAIGRSGGAPRRPTHDTRRHAATWVSVQDGGDTPRIGNS